MMVKNKEKETTKLKEKLLEIVKIHAKIKKTDDEGYGNCVTCGKWGHWSTMDGGHFMPESKGNSTKFELDNVNLQCKSCNGRGNQGEQYKHGKYIDREYGKGRSDEITRQASDTRKRHMQELEDEIERVENMIYDICMKKPKMWIQELIEYCEKPRRKAQTKGIIQKVQNLLQYR